MYKNLYEKMITSKFIYNECVQAAIRGHFTAIRKMGHTVKKLPIFLKQHSVSIVADTTKNCECLVAHKLRRGQQVLSFYRRLWGEAGFKNILCAMRQKLLKQIADRCRSLMLVGFCVSMFDWNKNRISETDIRLHYDDLDYIKKLTAITMTCPKCKLRLVVDTPVQGISYCRCEGYKPVYNKTYEDCPWMPFIERKNLLVWRRERKPNSGLYEYKLFGVYDEVRADVFLKVQVDTNYRKAWDPTAVEINVISSEPQTNSDIIYWEMRWPTFFSNRDYIFSRRFLVDPQTNLIVIKNQSTKADEMPVFNNKVRVTDYSCTMVIKPFTRFDEPGVEFCLTYYDDPGLSIPATVQTWVATSAMPDFLERLRLASVTYVNQYVNSHLHISPWPDNFVMPKGNESETKVVQTGSDHVNEDDTYMLGLYLDAFCAS